MLERVTGRPPRGTHLPRGAPQLAAAAPALGRPLYERQGLVGEAWRELRELFRYRELVRYTVSSSLKLETAGTILGAVWWLLEPLLLMLVYVVFVDVILQRGGENFALFVLVAVIAWKHFSSGCGRAMGNTVRHQELMKQVRFPRSVLPMSAVLGVTVHFVFGIGLPVAVAVAFGIYPAAVLPLVLVVAAIQLVLTLAFAFAFAGVNFFFRDLQPMVAYLFSLWFFLSPTLYPVSAVPAGLRPMYDVNPFTYLLESYRAIIMDGRIPDFGPLLGVAGASLALLAVAFLIFVRLEQSFTKVS